MPSEEWMGVMEARIEALEAREETPAQAPAVAKPDCKMKWNDGMALLRARDAEREHQIRELYEWALPGVVAACNPRCVADRMEKLWPWLADSEEG